MLCLKQSPQTKCTMRNLERRPNVLLGFAASSQCIRNAFRALMGPSQSSSIDPIEYIGFCSLVTYASAVAILQDVAREESISVNDSS